MPQPSTMERTIRSYFAACNAGDETAIAAFFTPGATHYFPQGNPFGILEGSAAIARCWARCVRELGSVWTVDNFCGDPDRGQAVIEWTHFKSRTGQILRGDEWYVFTPQGLIQEIRAYYAAPPAKGTSVHQIEGFDYEGRGYPPARFPSAR